MLPSYQETVKYTVVRVVLHLLEPEDLPLNRAAQNAVIEERLPTELIGGEYRQPLVNQAPKGDT